MKNRCAVALLIMIVFAISAPARDAQTTFGLLKKGRELSTSEAAALEQRIAGHPMDEEARVQLLAYYATRPVSEDLTSVKSARLRHILYLVANDPKDGFGLFQVASGVYLLRCQGGDLADPDGYKKVAGAWREQIMKNPASNEIKKNAATFFQDCLPEEAEQLLISTNDKAGLGRLYASAILGITGRTYENADPAGSDGAVRQGPFAQKARQTLEQTTDKGVLVSGAVTLLRDGGNLWADGNLDWDYTPFGNNLLAKAKQAVPDSFALLTLQTTLPKRGERPPVMIRIGGNVQVKSLLRKVTPGYPAAAKVAHVQGVVEMTVLIGLDGTILALHADGGPSELIDASVDAVRQWVYKPTLLNGRPCYVLTKVDVNFTIGRP